MPEEQNINRSRYMVIPRVLVFVTRGEEILLLQIAARNGKITRWTGRYNGLGGHIERGEDALTAAQRELFEEAGITAELRLGGVLLVDTGEDVGIELHVFYGEYLSGELCATREGTPVWVPLAKLSEIPLVEDAPILIETLRAMNSATPPFCGRSFYEQGELKVVIR
ncbi:MAG: hypothetical protein DDG60_02525 [Anaerolineae bacterium]|nr:MAG: hypothetical protein DDG60_02525 [Anaerolineae bacterium]